MPSIKKIMITGAGGQLGSYLIDELKNKFEVFAVGHTKPVVEDVQSTAADIRNSEQMEKLLAACNPDLLIHTAALSRTAPELYEPRDLFAVNVKATEQLALLCKKYHTKLIYTSTDLVYAGYRGTMLRETAKTVPATLYAETKLMGELKIERVFDNYIILRTALLIGKPPEGRSNFFDTMVNNLINEKPVKLFTDQFRSPLSFREASRIIAGIAGLQEVRGIINLGGSEKLSRLELGEKFCRIANLDPSLIQPVAMIDVAGVVPVEDVSMNIEKITKLGLAPEPTDTSLQNIARDYGLL